MADLSTTPDTTARCTVEDASCVRTLPDGSRLTVFDNLSLSVAPGTVLCVRGRSGSGKTTLLGVIGGLLRPTSGRVYWGGQEIWSLSEAERAARRRDQLAVILQDGGLIEWLTAEENVALSLSNGAAKNGGRIREILEQVGLGGRRRNYPHELSMGERERVAIPLHGGRVLVQLVLELWYFERRQQLAFTHAIADVHVDLLQVAGHLRVHVDLLERPEFGGNRDRLRDIARADLCDRHDGRDGDGLLRRGLAPARGGACASQHDGGEQVRLHPRSLKRLRNPSMENSRERQNRMTASSRPVTFATTCGRWSTIAGGID